MDSILHSNNSIRDKSASQDLVVMAIITLGAYLLSIRFDFAEQFLAFSRSTEHYEVDELLTFFLALTASLTWFSLRRWLQLRESFGHQISLQSALERSNQSKHNLIEENRRLLKALSDAQESERIKLARELHDAFGQHLTAIHANATAVKNRIKAAEDTPEYRAVECILGSTNFLHTTTRSLLKSLRPPDLDELGLKIAVTSLIDNWQSAHPEIVCDTEIRGIDENLDMDICLMYYRAVQECLVNIARHSEADQASIQLTLPETRNDTVSRLIVRDNGRGFTTESEKKLAQHNISGLGLVGLRERVIGLGGEFSIGQNDVNGQGVMLQISTN